MSHLCNLLLIDNNPGHAEVFREAVVAATDGRFQAEWVMTLSQGVERLGRKGIWAVFANLSLPDSNGLETFAKLLQAAPHVPTVVLAGIEDGAMAQEAMRHGAKDYLLEGHIDSYSFARAVRHM